MSRVDPINHPHQAAFDLLLEAMEEIKKFREMPEDEFRAYMNTARALIPFIHKEKDL